MGMEEMIPVVVTGGVVKKFSDSMLPTHKSKRCKKGRRGTKACYPTKHRPF